MIPFLCSAFGVKTSLAYRHLTLLCLVEERSCSPAAEPRQDDGGLLLRKRTGDGVACTVNYPLRIDIFANVWQ